MLIAGEASGDLLAAELVSALLTKVLLAESAHTNDVQPLRTQLAPQFFGAGGPKMAAAGVDLAFDMTKHSVIGISDVLKKYFEFKRLFNQLLKLAIERQPDVIIGVDFGGFNLRFGHAIKQYVRRHSGMFSGWNPKIVQFISPQVWASRPGRAYQLERDYDLLLSIFPFEKDWYARRVPKLRVEFVGHPIVGRFTNDDLRFTRPSPETASIVNRKSKILLLPGSRKSELQRHLPVMLGALALIQKKNQAVKARMVLPNESLAQLAKSLGAVMEIQIGNLPAALMEADVAIASTGTVTMECAFFGVPTVTMYKTSLMTYEIAKRIITVTSITMPNLLTGEEVFPEFIQHTATAENIANAAMELLTNESRRAHIKSKLAEIVSSLGGPGAPERAANAILSLTK